MITTKQRAVLRSLCNTLDPVMQIGKDGVNDGTKAQAEALFEARELFKVKVLNNCDLKAKAVADIFAKEFDCEVVQVIGNKFCVYRKSKRKNFKHIEF